MDEEAELMAEFVRTRDRRMFERLFQKYRKPMVAYAGRYVRDQARAEELAQEVFVRVYTTKNYTPDATFRTWIYRVATNICLNEIRRPASKKTQTNAEEVLAAAQGPAADRPDVVLEGKRLSATLDRALGNLPDKQRAAFLMVRLEGLPHDEVARALDTSVPSVKSLVHRALEALRKEATKALGAEGALS